MILWAAEQGFQQADVAILGGGPGGYVAAPIRDATIHMHSR
jgi:hypothetical protein